MKICRACLTENCDDAVSCVSGSTRFALTAHGLARVAGKTPGMHAEGDFITQLYQVDKKLGQGGMCIVYLASDMELCRKSVALKVFHSRIVTRTQTCRRFEDEVVIYQEVTHENIERVNDLKCDGKQRFLTIEYIPEETALAP